MIFNNFLGDGKAESRAFGAAGDVRFKTFLDLIRGKTYAVITNLKRDLLIFLNQGNTNLGMLMFPPRAGGFRGESPTHYANAFSVSFVALPRKRGRLELRASPGTAIHLA